MERAGGIFALVKGGPKLARCDKYARICVRQGKWGILGEGC
jgi:hypothetical protein